MNRRYLIPSVCITLLMLACQKEDELPSSGQYDMLNSVGILGEWEISSRTINNISDMLPLCCEFLEFVPDGNNADLTGFMSYKETDREVAGTFKIDPEANTIEFIFVDNNYVSGFEIKGDVMQLRYTENGDEIDDSWTRRK